MGMEVAVASVTYRARNRNKYKSKSVGRQIANIGVIYCYLVLGTAAAYSLTA